VERTIYDGLTLANLFSVEVWRRAPRIVEKGHLILRPVNIRMTITVAMLVVLLAAVTTTTVLGYLIYERTLSGLVTSRFEFIAKEFKSKLEAGIDLGLPLGQLENIDEFLHQEMLRDDSLIAISIVDTNGRILFDTRAEHVGKSTSDPWVRSLLKGELSTDQVYFGESAVGLPLFTSFGKSVGVLLVRYSGAFYDEKRLGVGKELVLTISVVLLAAGLIGIVGVLIISRPLTSSLARLGAGLDALRHRVKSAPPNGSLPPADLQYDSEIEHDLLEAISSIEQAEKFVSERTAGGCPPTEARS